MPLENDNSNNGTGGNGTDDGKKDDQTSQQQGQQPGGDQSEVERLKAAIQDIKGKLDTAFAQRDKALRDIKIAEDAQKEAQLKQMEGEGKKVEALELRLADALARIDVQNQRITELTRDVEIREALSGVQFRNDKAAKIAFKEIASGLVRDEAGVWKHASGATITTYVAEFLKDEDQAFLLKGKTSTGAGGGTAGGGSGGSSDDHKQSRKLTEYSLEEIQRMAQEGKLPTRSRRR